MLSSMTNKSQRQDIRSSVVLPDDVSSNNGLTLQPTPVEVKSLSSTHIRTVPKNDMRSFRTTNNDTKTAIDSANNKPIMVSPDKQPKKRRNELMMYHDYYNALYDMRCLTDDMGSKILINEANSVNQQLLFFRQRHIHEVKPGNKRRRIGNDKCIITENVNQTGTDANDTESLNPIAVSVSDDDDENDRTADESSSIASSCDESNKKTTGEKGPSENISSIESDGLVMSEDERLSLLRKAFRMKRMSNMFKQLQDLQEGLLHEIHDCIMTPN